MGNLFALICAHIAEWCGYRIGVIAVNVNVELCIAMALLVSEYGLMKGGGCRPDDDDGERPPPAEPSSVGTNVGGLTVGLTVG